MNSGLTEIFVSALMAGAMLWIIGKYLDIFLLKKPLKASTMFVWGLYFIYQFYAEYGKGNGSIFMLLLNVGLIFFVCFLGYEGSVFTKLFHTILICAIGALMEMMTYFCLQFLLPSHTVVFNSFGSVLSKFLFIILIILLNMKLGNYSKKRLPAKYIAMLLVIPVASVFIANDIFLLDNEAGSIRSMLSFSLLLAINCFIFEICQRIYENMETEHENIVFAQQLELMSKHTDQQKQMYERQREFRHNIKNYCIGLRVNIEHDDRDKALDMLDHMLDVGKPEEEILVNSGNDLIDSLINYKYYEAKKYNIQVETDILIPVEIPKVGYGDLTIILGNLIDNAIEAAAICQKVRMVNIVIEVKRNELIIDIRNTYEKEPCMDKQGEFMTGKADGEKHGFGIKSVKKAVEKYDGNVAFDMKEGVFEAVVIINLG